MEYTKAKDVKVGQHVYEWGEGEDNLLEVVKIEFMGGFVYINYNRGPNFAYQYRQDHPLVVQENQDTWLGEKVWNFYEGSDYNDCIDWLSELTNIDGSFRIVVYKLGVQ